MSSPEIPTGASDPALGTHYATFPRRLNAIVIDGVILTLSSILVFALAPASDGDPTLRITVAFVWWAAILLYDPLLVTWFGGTLGHRLQNLRVVDEGTGGNPRILKALGRSFLKLILGIISFFSMSFSRRHQAVHDIMTGSSVRVRDPSTAAPHHYVRPKPPKPTGRAT